MMRHLRRVWLAVVAGLVLVVCPTVPVAAETVTPPSCAQFVQTYLEGGLPNSTDVPLRLDVYRGTSGVTVDTVLNLAYAPYPQVAGQLAAPGMTVSLDGARLRIAVTTDGLAEDVHVLGCTGRNHVY